MTALAITDLGNLYGAFEFYKACKDAGIKPIVGVEVKVSKKGLANRDKDNALFSLTLLAKNHAGYKNLIQLVTKSYLEGFYFEPRVDFDLLERYGGDLLALSGNTNGEIPQHIITGKGGAYVKERLDWYQKTFGKGNFYLELHPQADNPHQ